jgi:exodeoxyribonuclease V gamma subunit
MLEVYHSNRLEVLVEALAEVTAAPLSDPFRPERIVVQNPGMARWINQQLAERTGISARLDYPPPAAFFWDVLKAWLPAAPDQELLDKDALFWRILRLLPERLGDPAFAPLQRYLAGDPTDLRLYQLTRRIAGLFDQYLVLRPEMVLGWEEGRDEHWQARLWRGLCADGDHPHRAGLFAALEGAMAERSPLPGVLPERVSVFGLTALAPVYVRLLGELSGFVPVHVFYLNPSREYWSDLVDERGQARRRARPQRAGLPDPTGLLDVGNPLLASLGHAGQVFLDQLLELGGTDHDLFEPPQGETLLHQLQRDILELADARSQSPPRSFPENDISIQIHSVHSALREVQVLRDRLLHLFEHLQDLEPRDVAVMAPDIDVYAPYVDAVFAAAAADQRIPWAIADRRMGAEQPVLEALKQLLALPRSRFEASEVLSLLEVLAIRRRFGLDDEGVERIRTWVRESGVRWGEDAAMGAGLGLPEERANTWAFGLDRLFLGYAMPPDLDADPYGEVLPYVDVEGGEVAYLGVLQSFLELLGDSRKRLTAPHTVSEWRSALNGLLAAFLAPDEEEEPVLQTVRNRLDALADLAGRTGFERRLSLDVMRALLEGVLEDTREAHRFLTGRVTFCNMVPMRGIPFRVICLIGMNGEDFPRSRHPPSFDLMAQAPRRGDRSRRRDDRYLFLEALLSARDVLYLSYVGNDVRDNSIKISSVVVSELLDYIGRAYAPAGGQMVEERLLVRHPLQPFSRGYFDSSDRRLFSYSRLWSDAARTEPGEAIPVFSEGKLGPPDDSLRLLDVEELIRFLRNPAQYFLTQRLGLRLSDEEEVPANLEPFDAEGLERYQLRQSVLRQRLIGRDEPAILARLRGEGVLPHGAPGELLLEEQLEVADPFVQRLALHEDEPLEPLEVDLDLGGFRLQGRLGNLRRSGLLDSRLGTLRCKDRLAIWVRHLVLNTLAPDGVEPESRFIAEDFTLTLHGVEDAPALLLDLLEIRWQGLREPLAFFPETALAWLEDGYGNLFYQAWLGDRGPPPEVRDLAVRIAFRGREPIGEAFEANALRILQPLLAHADTVKAKDELP